MDHKSDVKLVARSTTRLLLLALSMTSAHAAVQVDKVAYKGWTNCYRVSNGEVDLIVTADVGPRIMRYGFVGGQNLFKEFAEQMGKTGERVPVSWRPRRLEGSRVSRRHLAPDNVPVQVTVTPTGLTARRTSHRSAQGNCRRHGPLRNRR